MIQTKKFKEGKSIHNKINDFKNRKKILKIEYS